MSTDRDIAPAIKIKPSHTNALYSADDARLWIDCEQTDDAMLDDIHEVCAHLSDIPVSENEWEIVAYRGFCRADDSPIRDAIYFSATLDQLSQISEHISDRGSAIISLIDYLGDVDYALEIFESAHIGTYDKGVVGFAEEQIESLIGELRSQSVSDWIVDLFACHMSAESYAVDLETQGTQDHPAYFNNGERDYMAGHHVTQDVNPCQGAVRI